jgi:ABC-type nitrate/sulfonate/bicarbonate transport system substrate-binding protein
MNNYFSKTAMRQALPKVSWLAIVITALLVVGCAGGAPAPTQAPAEEPQAEGAPAELPVPRVALTSPTQPSYVETIYGPITYGPEFGLNMTADDFTIFDSHATATQSALAGQADIVGGSFISHLLLRERGQDFRVFCSFINLDDFVIAGRNGVTEIDQLFDPEVRVAVDSPGGAAEIILNSMLQAAGTGKTVADIPNTNILESSGLRTSAYVADEVDATVIHLPQFRQAAEQIPDAVIITTQYGDVPIFIKEAYAAPADWLDENLDTAAAFCASVIKASRELPEDFELYQAAVDQFVGEPPDEAELQEVFDLISQYEFWPTDGGLDPEAVTFMAEMAVTAGVLEEVPDPAEVVDRRAIEQALQMLGEQ